MFYWVIDYRQRKDGEFSPVIIGGRSFHSEQRAQEYIDSSNLSSQAEILELPTSQQNRATQMVKAILVRRLKSLDKGLTRATHRGQVTKFSEDGPPIKQKKDEKEVPYRAELKKEVKLTSKGRRIRKHKSDVGEGKLNRIIVR